MTDPRSDSKDATTAVLKALNAHGHPFAAAVLDGIRKKSGGSGYWMLRASEYAVVQRERDYHIDGVLQCRHASRQNDLIFATVECKRADPAVARWCFVRNAAIRGDGFPRRPIFDRYTKAGELPSVMWARAVATNASRQPIYQQGIELRTNAPGNGLGKALNDAVTQACRGAAGLVAEIEGWLKLDQDGFVVPVVATTAELLVYDRDLTEADAETGEIPPGAPAATSVPWLWLETHLSRDLSPKVSRRFHDAYPADPVGHALDHSQTRAVMIARGAHVSAALEEVALALSSVDLVQG